MKLSGITDAVIGLVSILGFAIQHVFTRTRCCICGEKIMHGELKYRIKEYMGQDTMCFRTRYPYCASCMNEFPKTSTTEIVCLNR